jgi:hypothetical protein
MSLTRERIEEWLKTPFNEISGADLGRFIMTGQEIADLALYGLAAKEAGLKEITELLERELPLIDGNEKLRQLTEAQRKEELDSLKAELELSKKREYILWSAVIKLGDVLDDTKELARKALCELDDMPEADEVK